jgi:hypothetical protein
MTYYVAIVEEEEGKAVGSGFRTCPAAFRLAILSMKPWRMLSKHLSFGSEAMLESGQNMPVPRSLTDLKKILKSRKICGSYGRASPFFGTRAACCRMMPNLA